MHLFSRSTVRDVLLLSLTAGSADAAGFMGLGHVFTSNMTGNVVLLGMSLGQGHWSDALRGLMVVSVFVLGAGTGAWLSRNMDKKAWTLIVARVVRLEAALLVIFAILWAWPLVLRILGTEVYLLVLLAFAMGLQASTLYRLKMPGVSTTAVTGTLASIAGEFVSRFEVPAQGTAGDASGRERLWFQISAISLYLGGAIFSGIVMLHWPGGMGILPAALVVFVVGSQGKLVS